VERAIKRFSGPDLHQKNVKKHFVSDRESADDLNGVCSAVIQRTLMNWGRCWSENLEPGICWFVPLSMCSGQQAYKFVTNSLSMSMLFLFLQSSVTAECWLYSQMFCRCPQQAHVGKPLAVDGTFTDSSQPTFPAKSSGWMDEKSTYKSLTAQ